MLERATTFVIGAGASFDLGFPLGDTLRDKIVEVLADEGHGMTFADPSLAKILQGQAAREMSTWTHKLDAYRRAAATIRAGLPFARSIDTFIDGLRHVEDVEFLSKLAIAMVILRAESASPLVQKEIHAANARQIRDARLKKLIASWHTELSQILYDGHSLDTLPLVFENVSFIVFNYDRCLEEFLTVSLTRRFGIARKDALALVATCPIIHPYGQTGSFLPEEDGFVPFGEFQDRQLIPVASRIRTFTETMESEVGDRIKELVTEAEVLVFMGFGWLPQNMELLRARIGTTNAQQVFATAMNMDPGEITVVCAQINEILKRGEHAPHYVDTPPPAPEFVVERGDCKALMNNCWLRLTRP